jgi:hypothetical protein
MNAPNQVYSTTVLTELEQQAINNINAVLNGDGSDPESGPGAWADCGEVDVPVVLDAVSRLTKLVYPATLTAELDEVLGWPNFHCAGFADAFRAAGHDIPHKAEREQAFVLHWLTGLVLKHGAGWQDAASSELAALREKIAVKGEKGNA